MHLSVSSVTDIFFKKHVLVTVFGVFQKAVNFSVKGSKNAISIASCIWKVIILKKCFFFLFFFHFLQYMTVHDEIFVMPFGHIDQIASVFFSNFDTTMYNIP